MMQDMSNLVYYNTKYSTKDNPGVKVVLSEQAAGVERLRLSEAHAQVRVRSQAEWSESQIEVGWKTMIRLETACHRSPVTKPLKWFFRCSLGHVC